MAYETSRHEGAGGNFAHDLHSASLTPGRPIVFKIERYKYAFGLHWQTPDDPKTVSKEAKKLAKMDGFRADLYLERRKVAPQFALGRSSEGLIPGAIGAAAVAAQALRGASSWAGIFRLGEGFWYVAVRDDFVLPDGDCYYVDETEAQERLLQERRTGDFLKFYAPEGWMDGAEDLPVTQFLGMERGPTLTEVNPFTRQVKGALAGIAVISIVLGGMFYYKSISDVNDSVKKQVEAKRTLEDMRVKSTMEKKEIEPWPTRPPAHEHLAGCLREMRSLPVLSPGYKFKGLVCKSNGFVEAAFKRAGGFAGWFQTWAKDYAKDGFVPDVSQDGANAALSKKLPEMRNRGETAGPIHDKFSAATALIEATQIYGDAINLAPPSIPPAPAGVDPKTYKPPSFAPARFTITTKSPDVWTGYFTTFNGIVIDSVDFDAATSDWHIQGDLYVRL
jgi:hypothetical protein